MQEAAASKRPTLIRYRDPKGAIEWLRAAFMFETRCIATRLDGSFAYAHLAFGEHLVTVTARDERSLGPAEPPKQEAGRDTEERNLTVEDIEAHFTRAKGAGVEIVRGMNGNGHGGRGFACRDPEGHIWSFATGKVPRNKGLRPWAGARLPGLDRLLAQRGGVAAAAALTVVALAIPAWRIQTMREAPAATAPAQTGNGQPLQGPAASSPDAAQGQALEHARFALVEEQAARLAAEASRRAALAELAQERAARLEAERNAEHFEAELSATRATRRAAEQIVRDLNDHMTWDTQVAPATESGSPSAQGSGKVVPVSGPEPSGAGPGSSQQPTSPPTTPLLAEGRAALAKGDVEAARRAFRRLADEGVPEAALALGSTYDPVNVERTGMANAHVDRARAKQWYRRAIELAQAATERQRGP